MDGGCGGQRPLWRASTAVVLLPATASVTAAAAAAPMSRCRRCHRGATARSRRHLRLQQLPPLTARRHQRGAAAAHSWLRTAGAPFAPRTANRNAPPQHGRRHTAPTTPSPAPAGTHDPSRRTTPPPPKMSRTSAAWERKAGRCGRLPLAEPPRRPWRTRPLHATPADEPTARPPLHRTLARYPPHQAPHPTLPLTPPRPPPRPTIPRTPRRQTPHRRHARHRALRTRAAPHPVTRHL